MLLANARWGVVQGAGRATRRNFEDPNTFWRKIPFPTLAAGEPDYSSKGDYWKGSVWAPRTSRSSRGSSTQATKTCREASEKYLAGMYEVFKKTGTVWENYSPDNFEQGNQAKPDFVGWTGDGPIALLIENVLGLRSDGADNELTWRLRRLDAPESRSSGSDRHGLGRVRSAGLRRRTRQDHGNVRWQFTLKVVKPSGEKVLKLKKGTQTVEV